MVVTLSACSAKPRSLVAGNDAEADGAVVMGKLKGSVERRYIPFTDVAGETAPVIASKGYVDAHAGGGVVGAPKVTIRRQNNADPDMVAPNTFILSDSGAGMTYQIDYRQNWQDGDTFELLATNDGKVGNANNIYYGNKQTNSLNISGYTYYKFVYYDNGLYLLQYSDTTSPRAN